MSRPHRPRGGPAARIDSPSKAKVVAALAAGATLVDAARDVGYCERTIRRESQRDRAFYDQLVEAIATGAPLKRGRRLAP